MDLLSEITEQLLRRANLKPGMRILDIGCGSGEITRAIADRVGPTCTVVGLDGSPAALATAVEATDPTLYKNLTYQLCNLSELPLELGTFDAIVGRRVLMYVPDLEKVIPLLLSILRPGGRIALQEHDTTMTPGRVGDWPVHDQVHAWLWESVEREGANPRLGFTLPSMLSRAGSEVLSVWAQAIFSGYEAGWHHRLHDLVKMMQPRLVASGVVAEGEIDLPTLERRLAAERDAHETAYVTDMAVCIIAQRSA